MDEHVHRHHEEDMLSVEDIATATVDAILAKNNVVHEEIVIRRTAGDIK